MGNVLKLARAARRRRRGPAKDHSTAAGTASGRARRRWLVTIIHVPSTGSGRSGRHGEIAPLLAAAARGSANGCAKHLNSEVTTAKANTNRLRSAKPASVPLTEYGKIGDRGENVSMGSKPRLASATVLNSVAKTAKGTARGPRIVKYVNSNF